MKLRDRIRKSFNVFRSAEEKPPEVQNYQLTSGGFGWRRPDRSYFRSSIRGQDITNAIYTRIAVDFSNVDMRHVRLDSKGRYKEDINSGLNECLTLRANIDQGSAMFRRDICHTMLEEGTVVILPVDTDDEPEDQHASVDILSMRVGTVVNWFPEEVRVRAFRQETQRYEEVTVPKQFAAVIENPFYSVMNEENSTLKRLARKISLLDAVDEQIGSGKLDLIIQLPYIVKTDSKRAQAEKRRSELEDQLQSSQYGVAYTDGTERITQLNRPVENNLLKNVESLTHLLYQELGITAEILNGTASEETMLNYQSRMIKPLLEAVAEGMRYSFLTKTARTQGQSIEYFNDPFTLVPVSKMAEIADKLTRNAIVSSNEMRQILGLQPVDDEMADALVNKNLPLTPDTPVPIS